MPRRGIVAKPRVERRFMPLNPGYPVPSNPNPEGVEYGRNPFRVGPMIQSLPRVGRKKRGQPWALRSCPFRAVFISSIILFRRFRGEAAALRSNPDGVYSSAVFAGIRSGGILLKIAFASLTAPTAFDTHPRHAPKGLRRKAQG